MKKTTLVIMAAGLGSRFGEGLKQLAKVGPGGEIILDYSIHDALEAGFNKIVFIIRKDIEAEFGEQFTGTTKGEAADYIDKWLKTARQDIDRSINWDAESRFG